MEFEINVPIQMQHMSTWLFMIKFIYKFAQLRRDAIPLSESIYVFCRFRNPDLAYFKCQDFDIEIAFDAKFFFPILFRFFSGVLSDHDHFGNVGDRFISPAPSDFFKATTDFSKYSFQ